MTIKQKQKLHDALLVELTALLEKHQHSIVAFNPKDGDNKITLRLVHYEDLDKFNKAIEDDVKKQIEEQMETINEKTKGDKIKKVKKVKVHI